MMPEAGDLVSGGGLAMLSALAGHFVPAWLTRRKDAGDLAAAMLGQCIERIGKLEKENADCSAKTAALERRCERNEIALRLTLTELHARAPGSPILRQAHALLGEAFQMTVGQTAPDRTTDGRAEAAPAA